MTRITYIRREVFAGCFVCSSEGNPIWTAKNAQAVAAKHHDATGHRTWVEIAMGISYGAKAPSPSVEGVTQQ